jgi:hypothetical protein
MSIPNPITITSAAPGVVGTLTLFDHSDEIGAIATAITAASASIAVLAADIALINAEITKLQTYLLAVQSPTGDFRTVSPEDVAGTALVNTALAKSIPPIVPLTGPTT